MNIFAFHAPTRIVFGSGVSLGAGAELAAMGARRAFVVTGPGATARSAGLAAVLESLRAAGLTWVHWAGAGADPLTSMADEGAAVYLREGCDSVLAFGGGSPIDCAKGIAATVAEGVSIAEFLGTGRVFKAPLPPLVAVPTTAGTGSEVTSNAVFILEKEGLRRKIGTSGPTLFPRLALVDPDLQASMPPALTAATGMDALTHAVEAYVSKFHTPAADLYCLESVRLIGLFLRRACADGGAGTGGGPAGASGNAEARAGMAWASTLAGVALTNAGLGMVHGIAHPVGALTGMAHGLANAIVLPHVMRALAPDAETRLADIGRALGDSTGGANGAGRAVEALARLGADIGVPSGLRAAGVPEKALGAIIADALTYRRRPASPRAFTDGEIADLVRSAWRG